MFSPYSNDQGLPEYDSYKEDTYQPPYEAMEDPGRPFDRCCFLPRDDFCHQAYNKSIGEGLADLDGMREHNRFQAKFYRLAQNSATRDILASEAEARAELLRKDLARQRRERDAARRALAAGGSAASSSSGPIVPEGATPKAMPRRMGIFPSWLREGRGVERDPVI